MKKFLFVVWLTISALNIVIAQSRIILTGNTDGSVKSVKTTYLPTYFEELSDSQNLVLSGTAFKTELKTIIPQEIQVWADSSVYYLISINEYNEKMAIRKGQEEQVINNEVNFYVKNGQLVGTGGGKNAIPQSFYNEYKHQFPDDYESMMKKSKDLTIDAFEDLLYKQKSNKMKWLEKARQENPFIITLTTLIKKEINYSYYSLLLGYAAHDCVQKKSATSRSLPSSISEEIRSAPVNDDQMMFSSWYRNFLLNYAAYFGSEANGFKNTSDFNTQARQEFNLIENNYKGNSKLYALGKLCLFSCDKINPELVKSMVTQIKEYDQDKKVLKFIEKHCETPLSSKAVKLKEEKQTEKNSLYPVLSDLKGMPVNLEQFIGKVVYIDFWASWCGPCRQQFPFSKKLHSSLTKKQLEKIVFLYVSIDESETAWKNAVEQFSLPGIHTISRGGWTSEVCKFFQITSIPRYMILNKKGKIVEQDAKRPSDESLKEDLLNLIAE